MPTWNYGSEQDPRERARKAEEFSNMYGPGWELDYEPGGTGRYRPPETTDEADTPDESEEES